MPIHQGLPKEQLYNGNVFRTVAVCLDSGKLATEACYMDIRGERVAYANVYPGDEPEGTCDKHVSVEFCYAGRGVATEYCYLDPAPQVGKAGLLKLTSQEIAEINAARGYGLADVYTEDKYVYLADGGTWNGFRNSLGNTAGTPYFTCPVHTHNYWEGIYGEDGYTGDEGSGDWENPASPGTGW